MILARWTATVFTLRCTSAAFSFEIFWERYLRIEYGLARRDALDGADQVKVHGIFQDVTARAGRKRLAHQRFLGMHAQHQDSSFWKVLKNFSRCFDAAKSRHCAVHYGNCGPKLAGEAGSFLAVAGFTHDGDVRVVFQHAPESAAHQCVIVGKKNGYFMRHWRPLFPGESEDEPWCRLAGAARSPACRQSVQRVRAWPPSRSRAAFLPRQNQYRDLPLQVPVHQVKI